MAAPTVTARSGGNSGTVDSTSHTITMPSFSTGQLLLVIFGCDQSVNISVSSGTGWNCVGSLRNGQVTLSIFWKIATGSGDNLTLTTDSAQQSIHNSYAISGGYYVDGSPSAPTDGAFNTHWPVDSTGDYLSIVGAVVQGTVTMTTPAGYANGQLRNPPGADGTSIFSAEAAFTNVTSLTGGTIGGLSVLAFTFHLAISEADPSVHGYPRVYSRETTDLSATTQTTHVIRMPKNIESGDMILVFASVTGNTSISIGSQASVGWMEIDGDTNNATVSGGVYYRVANGISDSLTLTTGTAQRSYSMAIVVKNYGNILARDPNGTAWQKASSSTLDEPQTFFAPRWRKILYFSFANLDAQDWWASGVNAWVGFAGSTGPGMAYGEWGYGLSYDINWAGINFGTTRNYISWLFAVEGKQCNDIEYKGYQRTTFAGTSSAQNISLTAINNPDTTGTITLEPGDFLLLGYASGSAADRAIGVNSTGWTRIDTKRYVNGTTYDVNMTLYWKVMGDTPDTTVQVTGTLNNADAGAVIIHVFRGVNQTDPIDAVTWTSGTGTSLPTPASLDYVVPGSWPIQFVAQAAANTGTTGLVPGTNWYWIGALSSDTNSVLSTINYSRGQNIRFVPTVYTGGSPAVSAGNSWGAYTLALKPAYAPSSYSWNHEAGTQNTFADLTSTLSSIGTTLGVKGSLCANVLPNSTTGVVYTQNWLASTHKYYVQGRFKVNVTQNPTANSDLRILSLNSIMNANTTFTSAALRVQISTTGSLSVSFWNDEYTYQFGSNVAINANTWYWASFLYDASNSYGSLMSWKLNNVTQNTASSLPWWYKPHRLIGRSGEVTGSGSTNWNGFIYFDNVSYSETDWPDYPTGRPKVYNGSTWVNKPLKRWTGSAWVEEPMYYYNGTNWEYIT